MIKRNSFLLFIVMLFTSSMLYAAGKGFTITGEVAGMQTGFVYLSHQYNNQTIVDSAKIEKEHFVIKGILPEPLLCTLKLSGNNQQVSFIVENKLLAISINPKMLFSTLLIGSEQNDSLVQFNNDLRSTTVIPKRRFVGDTIFTNAINAYVNKYIEAHKNWLAAAIVIYDRYVVYTDYDRAIAFYEMLSINVKQSFYGKRIRYFLDARDRTAIGNKALDFQLPDSLGKQFALQNFKGKYVLIDFWASWCVPCRKESPFLIEADKQFKNKDFVIISVSLDADKAQWLSAVATDKLTWLQLHDSKGFEGKLANDYGIKSIPKNFLLDKTGKIIAKNLRGDNVLAKLKTILE